MQDPTRPFPVIRDRLQAALSALPLPPGALLAVAEAAGAPPLGASGEAAEGDAGGEIAAFLLRIERVNGALPRALALLAVACPEQAKTLHALAVEAGAQPASSNEAALAVEASRALNRSWALLNARGAWRWERARSPLAEARALMDGPLRADPEHDALQAWADNLDKLVKEIPARLATIPGHQLARALRGAPLLAGLVLALGQGLAALPRLWPLTPLLLVLAVLLGHEPPPLSPAAPGMIGYTRGSASAESVRADLRSLSPATGAHDGATPEPEARPAPTAASPTPSAASPPDAAVTLPAPPLPEPSSASDEPLADLDRAPRSTAASAGGAGAGEGAGEGGGYGGAYGSGTVRHTALPDRAPMAFLGVQDMPPLPGQPEAAELWVAQTEVTEAQWQALMRLDLAILTGRPERPAEHMTWCEALTYANLLSKKEGLKPAYDVPRGCHSGASVRWDTSASGYRLPTEAEWERMAGRRPGAGATRRDVVYSGERDGAGLFGVSGNASELVWASDGHPVARHRSCDAENIGTELWPESAPLPCRQELPPGQRVIGVGLRLVRAADGAARDRQP